MALSKQSRKRIAGLLWLLAVLPVMPIIIPLAALHWIGRGAEWLVHQTADRYGSFADRHIERWLRVDPETEYQEWKDNMRNRHATPQGER